MRVHVPCVRAHIPCVREHVRFGGRLAWGDFGSFVEVIREAKTLILYKFLRDFVQINVSDVEKPPRAIREQKRSTPSVRAHARTEHAHRTCTHTHTHTHAHAQPGSANQSTWGAVGVRRLAGPSFVDSVH